MLYLVSQFFLGMCRNNALVNFKQIRKLLLVEDITSQCSRQPGPRDFQHFRQFEFTWLLTRFMLPWLSTDFCVMH
jgi:hypothetical protein